MAWKQLANGGGPILKWEKGTVVEGLLGKIHEGKFGPLVDIELESGSVKTYPVKAVLKNRLDGVLQGTLVRIECLGQTIKLKNGNLAYDFAVFEHDGEPDL